MVALALELLAAIWRSAAGRMALVAILAGLAGWWGGFREGDKGRLILQAKITAATATLLRTESIRAADIAAEGEREALAEEHEDAERQRQLEEANVKIAELEKASACVISRETVRAINRGR